MRFVCGMESSRTCRKPSFLRAVAQMWRRLSNYCHDHRIPLYVYGGGSTVTRGMEAVKGGICLDLSTHMRRVLSFNETDQTITVEPGIWGPELEDILNRAPEILSASRAYTCGHFPQSFEHSSVGGWVVTRGAGQNSTYYGKIEDILYSLEMVYPGGVIRTPPYPRSATGPDFRQILAGSEGTFGVVTSVTLRVFRHTPQTTRRYAWLFRSWEDALETYREVMQSESGFPSVFRLSDPEETDVAMRTYHIHGTPADSLLRTLGLSPCSAACCSAPAAGRRTMPGWLPTGSTRSAAGNSLPPHPLPRGAILGEIAALPILSCARTFLISVS